MTKLFFGPKIIKLTFARNIGPMAPRVAKIELVSQITYYCEVLEKKIFSIFFKISNNETPKLA